MCLKKILLFLFFCGVAQAFSQVENQLYDDELKSDVFGIQSYAWSNSNILPANILNGFTSFGSVSQAAVNNALASNANRVHLGFNIGISAFANVSYSSQAKEKGNFLHFSFRQKILGSSLMGNDAMKLLLGGNKQFEDKTASVEQARFFLLNYQSIKAGFLHHRAHYTLGVNFGIAAGRNFQQFAVQEFKLYTAPMGEFLDFTTDLNIKQNIAANYFNGFGALVDFYYQRTINQNLSCYVNINDFGFLQWNKNTKHLESKNEFSFNGFAINDLYAFQPDDISIEDTLRNALVLEEQSKSYFMFLPTSFSFGSSYKFSEKYSLVARLEYLSQIHVFPLLQVKNRFSLNQNLQIDAGLLYGGSGRLNSTLALAYRKEKIQIAISSLMNEGLIFSQSRSGNGLMLKFLYLLK